MSLHTLTTTLTHHQPANKAGHRYQEHQEQNSSPLINQLELVHDTDTISYIITGLQKNSIMPHLDSSDRIQLPLVCTFV